MEGSVSGEDYSWEHSLPTNIESGRLQDQFDQVILEWEGSLSIGGIKDLTGTIAIRDEHSLAGETICITEGVFGPVPQEMQPEEGILYRFLVTGARMGADCSGDTVSVDLDGCWYRDNTYLP